MDSNEPLVSEMHCIICYMFEKKVSGTSIKKPRRQKTIHSTCEHAKRRDKR